jgi:subtilisin family serine protease
LGQVLIAWSQAVPGERLYPVTQDSEGLTVAEGRSESAGQQNDQARITVTGSRISEGNAIDCPKIRTDDGQVYSVSYLAPSIAIGDRVIVSIDDGFDYNHPDLAPNYDTFLGHDFDANNNNDGANDLDPFGQAFNAHGTAVNGIIGADDNGTGAVGMAFDTSFVGCRIHKPRLAQGYSRFHPQFRNCKGTICG